MAKIVGNTVGIPNPQSDYDQTDKTKADYIKNKPDIVAIIKANAVGDISDDMDSSLPPTVEFMIRYLEGLPYGEDVQVLRQEMYDNYVSNNDLNDEVVEIIRENTQQYINEDTSLPPSVQCMVDYVNSMPFGEDIEGLRSELYDYYVSNEDLNYKVGQTDNYIRHDMRIENLELANGDISAALDAILAIHDELIGGDA